MSSVPQPPRFKLTIGEMFPADDLVAQWVFTLTSLAEDVAMVMSHLGTEELREKMLFYRLLLTRLYEARRLIMARAKYPEIEEFTSAGLTFGGVDLVAAYTRPLDGKSPVEQLYSDSRHRAVHYSKIGEAELRGLLHEYRNFPAHMVMHERDHRLSLEYKWVTAIRAEEAWGARQAAAQARDMLRPASGDRESRRDARNVAKAIAGPKRKRSRGTRQRHGRDWAKARRQSVLSWRVRSRKPEAGIAAMLVTKASGRSPDFERRARFSFEE